MRLTKQTIDAQVFISRSDLVRICLMFVQVSMYSYVSREFARAYTIVWIQVAGIILPVVLSCYSTFHRQDTHQSNTLACVAWYKILARRRVEIYKSSINMFCNRRLSKDPGDYGNGHHHYGGNMQQNKNSGTTTGLTYLDGIP